MTKSMLAGDKGVLSSKNDEGFSPSSGDFLTLGSDRDGFRKTTESSQDHGPHSHLSSVSGRVAQSQEQPTVSHSDLNSRSVIAWKRDGQSAEDGPQHGMEKWQGNPHQYLRPNVPPQHFNAFRGPMNGPANLSYGGPPGWPPYGAPYGAPVTPGSFPIEPSPYFSPGLYYGSFEGCYGLSMGYCNSNDGELPLMGMPPGLPVYNRYSGPNTPDPSNTRARYGSHGKGKFDSHDDGWTKRPIATESSSVASVTCLEPASNVHACELGPQVEAVEQTSTESLSCEKEVLSESHYSADTLAQLAKMRQLAERASQLQKEDVERIKQQKAKGLAKLKELNRLMQAGFALSQKDEKSSTPDVKKQDLEGLSPPEPVPSNVREC